MQARSKFDSPLSEYSCHTILAQPVYKLSYPLNCPSFIGKRSFLYLRVALAFRSRISSLFSIAFTTFSSFSIRSANCPYPSSPLLSLSESPRDPARLSGLSSRGFLEKPPTGLSALVSLVVDSFRFFETPILSPKRGFTLWIDLDLGLPLEGNILIQ